MWRFEVTTNLIQICNKLEDKFLTATQLQNLFRRVQNLLSSMIVDVGHSDKVIVFEKEDTEKVMNILKENDIKNFDFIER